MACRRALAALLILLAITGGARADASNPTKDIPGAADSKLLKRYEGSFIVSYEKLAFTDFKVPLSPLERTEKSDSMNNIVFAPKQVKELEGSRTRLVYVLPPDRSPLEVLRNYQDEITQAGGAILFTCKGEECGGDATRSSSGGGGRQSLLMQFVTERELKETAFSNGECSLTRTINDQRFLTGTLPGPDGDVYVTVQTYQLIDTNYCKALNNRTVAVVHLLEPRPRDRKMVTVSAKEMATSIAATGRIALYGILFDTDKADLKPASDAALVEISTLLKNDPRLSVLVVGHTDSQGSFESNIDLSRRRADSVVRALTTTYKIDPKRLRAAGAGMIAPTAPNDTDEGRAKNRRVEIVKLN